MCDIIEENAAGRYEIIRDGIGSAKPDGRFYYRTYIPASLALIDYEQFATCELASRLGFIYKEIGIQQGLAFHESDFRGKNRQFYKQEIIALLENHDNQISLTDIFSCQMPQNIWKYLSFYDCMKNGNESTVKKILLGKVQEKNQKFLFREKQIWEEARVKRVSIRGYNPPAPERVPELMLDLYNYNSSENSEIDVIIKAGFLCYQFLTIMPYEENNEVWVSILLNSFFREQGIGTDYYVPFARYLLEKQDERKRVMQQVREECNYDVWIRFFLKILEKSYVRINQIIMQFEKIEKDAYSVISEEKTKAMLQDVIIFMENNPIFVIGDIEKNFHTAYNTAAKSVGILEKHGLIREMSNKQRYRIYTYEKYIQEILK